MKRLPKSSKPHEDDRYWCARNVLGFIHALLVSILSVPVMFSLIAAPDYAQFAFTSRIGLCLADSSTDHRIFGWLPMYRAIAVAGLAFTSFTACDILVSSIHGLMTWDLLIHHTAFLCAGIIIRGHCILPFNASVLMSMEVSTPFLNYMLLVRNRGEQYQLVTKVCGAMFFATFVCLRIALNTYGVFVLWKSAAPMLLQGDTSCALAWAPPWVPRWELYFLLAAVSLGAIVQMLWFPGIFSTFVKGLTSLFGKDRSIEDLQHSCYTVPLVDGI